MYSPPDDETRIRMLTAHALAAQQLDIACAGEPVWGFAGCTIGQRAGDRWLRTASTAKGNAGRRAGEGVLGASTLIPDDVPRPRLHDVLDWTDGDFAYTADVIDFIPHPVISPHRADLDHDPDLTDEWWTTLHRSLTRLGQADGIRTTIRDRWIEKAFPQFLGIPAPEKIERMTGHGDLHWGNLTAPLVILDWERWGKVPVGYDPGLLHANSLLVPAVAKRIRAEFPILDTPSGRIGELAALAEMLQAVARGWYPELAPLLAVRARELTGIQPPAPAHSEVAG
ncbi:hypothetical protein [Kitasatospora sp. NPDC085879]|uniref:hypothetical protein n=1 Tax=Kitasatospora sp. NPDC085879 TaxID=3154769 RepID=UPI00343431AC